MRSLNISQGKTCTRHKVTMHAKQWPITGGPVARQPVLLVLGFYKAFARSLPVGKERGPWIKEVLPAISDPDAMSRRDEPVAQGVDISDYLAIQGRHAITHAEREDIVDPDAPDDPEDHQRIHQDKPLMRHLAEIGLLTEGFSINYLASLGDFRKEVLITRKALKLKASGTKSFDL
ncbi:methylamine utilization protein MauJ [Pseudomonas syringae]|uniref:methylamine utilization protein MauJ n=2 Tax=Pseudomonas syringae TaxID=317 RepID=UPI000EFF0C13